METSFINHPGLATFDNFVGHICRIYSNFHINGGVINDFVNFCRLVVNIAFRQGFIYDACPLLNVFKIYHEHFRRYLVEVPTTKFVFISLFVVLLGWVAIEWL